MLENAYLNLEWRKCSLRRNAQDRRKSSIECDGMETEKNFKETVVSSVSYLRVIRCSILKSK